MKSPKAAVRSFKNLVVKTNSSQTINPNTTFGVTIIPEGNSNVFVALPNLQNTYTYNIINTDEMTGTITLKTSNGASLKGLVLNTVGGSLSITPISQGTTSLEMANDVKDGCFIQTLSSGQNWFVWSVATGGSLGIGQAGNNNVATPSGTVTQIPAPVTLNPIQIQLSHQKQTLKHDTQSSSQVMQSQEQQLSSLKDQDLSMTLQ